MQVRLRERKDSHPTFLKVLNEICEEENEAARPKISGTLKSANHYNNLKPIQIEDLRPENKEMRLKLSDTCPVDPEVQALRAHVHQLTVLSVGHNTVFG